MSNLRRPNVRPRLVFFAMVFCALVRFPEMVAQSPQLNSVNDMTQTPVAGVGHNYQNLLGETVNLSNGSVSFKLSFPVPKGRGIALPYAWTYNSASVTPLDIQGGNTLIWDYTVNHNWPNKDGWNLFEGMPYATEQVWTLTASNVVPVFPSVVPTGGAPVPCNFLAGMTFVDPSGVTHNLNTGAQGPYTPGGDTGSAICPNPNTLPPNGDGQVVATLFPNTAINNLNSSNPTTAPFAVMDKNGTVYQFQGGLNTYNEGTLLQAYSVEDRNGNLWGGTDTAGRLLPGVPAPLPDTSAESSNTITSDSLSYTATWNTSPDYVGYTTGFLGWPPTGNSGTVCGAIPSPTTPTGITSNVEGIRNALYSLQLPNYTSTNKQQYGFSYDPEYGLLDGINYPDGGWVRYTWQLPAGYNEMAITNGFTLSPANVVITTSSDNCVYQYQTPVLATRTVSFDGTNAAQTQSFVFTTNWPAPVNGAIEPWTTKTTLVTTTDNTTNLTTKTLYTYIPLSPPTPVFGAAPEASGAIPLESIIQYYDWGQSQGNNPPTGSPIKTVTKTWYDQFNLQRETTTINATNEVSGTIYNYTSGLCPSTLPGINSPGNPSFVYLQEQDDYDFGHTTLGPLKKKTIYSYISVRLDVEQIQLVSEVGLVGSVEIGLKGA